MSTEFLKTDKDMGDERVEMTPYQEYLNLGGVINENDYNSALSRIKDIETVSKPQTSQVNGMLDFANIELDKEIDLNRVTQLYSVLRNDTRPAGVKHHHDQMNDHKILREALRMLGDKDALRKLKTAYHTNRPPGTYCPLCGKTENDEDCP